ncbi:MAG: A/G-specific adenine glycosylase [SAR324 cluster bacterium]|nr:A/G-specific adenine glycosylase [SAR324 cluster bacterium]
MSLPKKLTAWFKLNQRALPWRVAYDPYQVWVSEIMLQQTRVEAVLPYFANWISLFPDLVSLATAKEGKVLKAWEGLGYYSRARNLHKAAKELVSQNSQIPSDLPSLLAMPGVGPYTAGAISSIAFNLANPLLDGNVKRVFSRLLDWEKDVSLKETETHFLDFGKGLLTGFEPRTINQGLMELGALVCTPKSPKCPVCPWVSNCKSRENNTVDLRPVKLKKIKIVKETRDFFVFRNGNKYYLELQPDKGRWAKMYNFPNQLEGEIATQEVVSAQVELLCEFKYSVTVYQVKAAAYLRDIGPDFISSPNGAWLTLDELESHTLPRPAVQIRKALQQL